MKTLLIKNTINQHWYPQPVAIYKKSIKIPANIPENYRFISNFTYSMQYIEYLEKQIDESKLSKVLKKMVYKSYIITGMGIVELILAYRLQVTGNWNTTEWMEYCKLISNQKEIDNNIIKIETVMYKKVEQYSMRMDLDSMIKKAEKKRILTLDHSTFPALKKLRELRNRVHLQAGEGALDHDYNTIGLEEIQMMRRILYAVLTSPEICNCKDTYEFIDISYKKYK